MSEQSSRPRLLPRLLSGIRVLDWVKLDSFTHKTREGASCLLRYDSRMQIRRATAISLLLVFALSSTLTAASREPVRAKNGIVASTSEEASRVGVEVMKKGGNAIDAAVAVALALAVTWPSAGNLGGGGFMMIRRADGTTEIIDYRERAPLVASRDMYLDEKGDVIEGASTTGWRAVAVPGTVAGLGLAHQRHGTMKWRELVAPAEKLARDGFIVNYYLGESLCDEDTVALLSKFDESRRIFLRNNKPPAEGELWKQPELGRTLHRIATAGPRDFYTGDTARLIIDAMKANGGIITSRDLREYEPTLRKPLKGSYRGHEILTMPPPSSGGIALLAILNMLETQPIREPGSAAEIHYRIEASRRAFADRATYLGDTDFVKGIPVERLASKEYARELASTISVEKATPSSAILELRPAIKESPETTHFTIIDREGNIVTNTYTLNNSYGSGVTVPGTGMLLNNEMDDFTSKPGVPNLFGLIQSERNAIEPKKRPLSSMVPTIVLKDGKPLLALGSPGGPTIISTVLQVIVNVIDHGMSLQEAVDATRVHHQWAPDEIFLEPRGLNADSRAKLEVMGHRFRARASYMGDAQAIMIEPATGVRLGASDPRLGGAAVGW